MSDSDSQKTNPQNPGSLLQSSLKIPGDIANSLKARVKNRRRFLSPAPQIYEPISVFSPSGSIASNDSPLGSLADSNLKPLYKNGSPNMGTSKNPYASLSLFSPKDSRANIDTPQMSHEDLSEFRGLHDRSDFIQMSTPRRRGKSEIDMSETPRASWTDRTERQIEEIIAGAGKIIVNTKTEESFSFMEQDHDRKNTHERHETSIEMEESEVNKNKEKRERREKKGEEKEIEIVKEKKKKRDKEKSESSRKKKERGEDSSESPNKPLKESSESPKKSKSKKEKSEERSEDTPKEKKKKRHSEKKEKVEGVTEEKSKKRKSKSKSKSKSKTPETKSGLETLRHSQLDKINEADKENEEERETTKNNDPETEPRQLDTHDDNNMNHSIHSHHSNNSEIILVKNKFSKGLSLRKLLASKQLSSGISDQGTPQHADLTNASLVSTGGFGTFTSLNNLLQLHPQKSEETPKLKLTTDMSVQLTDRLTDRVDKKTRKSKKEMTFKEGEKLSRKSTKEHKEHKETKDKKEKEKKSHRKKSKKPSKTLDPAVPASSNEIVEESESLLNKPREVLATDGLDLVKLLFNRLHRKKTKFLVVFFTMIIIGTFVLNSLDLADLVNTTCEAQTIFGLSYLGFILMVILKISSISLLNLELTFQQPYKPKIRLAYPFLAFFLSPLLQVPQNVYSFETCKSQSKILNLEQSWKFLGAAIASLVLASLFCVFRKKIKLELSKVSLVARCWSLVSKLFIAVLGLTFIAWNVIIFVLFVGQRPNVSGNLIYEVLVSIILAGSVGMFWLGRKLLGEEKLKGLFIKEEEKVMEGIVIQGEEEKEKLEVIKEEREDDGGPKDKEENDLEKIEIRVN